jgi:hypothetical protein
MNDKNHAILECPRCLNMFVASTFKTRRMSENVWATKCVRCSNIIEFCMDYMEPVELWAQPNVANRIRKIDRYQIRVEGLTYSKSSS